MDARVDAVGVYRPKPCRGFGTAFVVAGDSLVGPRRLRSRGGEIGRPGRRARRRSLSSFRRRSVAAGLGHVGRDRSRHRRSVSKRGGAAVARVVMTVTVGQGRPRQGPGRGPSPSNPPRPQTMGFGDTIPRRACAVTGGHRRRCLDSYIWIKAYSRGGHDVRGALRAEPSQDPRPAAGPGAPGRRSRRTSWE